MTMRKRLFCGLLTATMTISAMCQTNNQSGTISPYSQFGVGLLADQSQTSMKGMAGTGLALRGGTMVNALNPASYSAVDSLTMLFDAGLSAQLTNFKEGGIRVNARNADFDYAIGLFRLRNHLGMSFGLLPYSDVGYSYTTSSYLNNNVGTITQSYSGKGGLHQVFVGMGWSPVKPLSVGVNAAFLWGNYTRSVASSATTTVNSLSKTYEMNVNSYNITFGLQWQQPMGRHDEVTLGATLGLGHQLGADPTCQIMNTNTSTQVSDTTTLTINNGLKLPMTYGVGLAWRHRESLTVAADVQMQQWGSVDYPDYDEQTGVYALRSNLLRNRTRMSIGVDYVANPNHPTNYFKHVHLRCGATYATPYYYINGQDGPKELTLSAGLGLPLLNKWENRSMLNISAGWVHTSAKDLITDNTFRISLGLTFNERWFAKFRIN